MLDDITIPDDLVACQQMIRDLAQAYTRLDQVHQELLATCSTIQGQQEKLERERDELKTTISGLLHQLYGRRSERWRSSPEQLQLAFDDPIPVEVIPEPADEAEGSADGDGNSAATKKRRPRRKKRRGKIGTFPDHLTRVVDRVTPTFPEGVRPEDCQFMGLDIVEHLEWKPPELWVHRIEYEKYIIPSQPELKIVEGPRVMALSEGGCFGFSVGATVLYHKFALHLPLYRQQDMYSAHGWIPNRSTLCQIVMRCAELLNPLAGLLQDRLLLSDVIHTDDTPVTLLTPGEDPGSRTARFWIYRGGVACPYEAFAFTDSRERAGPDKYLESFRGLLGGDCYSGYVNIEQVTHGRIKFFACHAHARRYFRKAQTERPEFVCRILAIYRHLYDVEMVARDMTAADRLALRQRESMPMMKELQRITDHITGPPVLPKSKLGKALNYLKNNWEALTYFLTDGRASIDNNDAERNLRRIAIGRKNWMFVGSADGGARIATILTVIASAHRHDLDVWTYLRDVLERLAKGEQDLASLLPDVWKTSHPDAVRTFREEERRERHARKLEECLARRRDRLQHAIDQAQANLPS